MRIPTMPLFFLKANIARISLFALALLVLRAAVGTAMAFSEPNDDAYQQMLWRYFAAYPADAFVVMVVIAFMSRTQKEKVFLCAALAFLLQDIVGGFLLMIIFGPSSPDPLWPYSYALLTLAVIFGVAIGRRKTKGKNEGRKVQS